MILHELYNLPTTILPPVVTMLKLNNESIDTGLYINNVDVSIVDVSIELYARYRTVDGIQVAVGVSTDLYLGIVNGNFVCRHGQGAGITGTQADDLFHKFLIKANGQFLIDDVIVGQDTSTSQEQGQLFLGCLYSSFYADIDIKYCKIWISGTILRHYIPSASKKYLHDITGNHTAILPETSIVGYSQRGDSNLFVNGFSIWSKSGESNEIVPLGASTAVIAGDGYIKVIDVDGDELNLNSAPCIIDFDPVISKDVKLEIFNRANTTIHNATSRSSVNYNASYPYRWHISELVDYAIYSSYFNFGYNARLFTNVMKSVDIPIKLLQILNYATQKNSAETDKIKAYCKIT